MSRPYILLSAAVSLDGYLDDAGPDRLLLSNAADFDQVDQLRADCDAILVGAGTLRADNPRLLVRDQRRRADRVAAGRAEHPVKVTVSNGGNLAPALAFWRTGGAKLVYTSDDAAPGLRARLAEQAGGLAEVVPLGAVVEWPALLADLGRRGIGRLLVEGGGQVHTQLLAAGLFDELRLAVAPIMVGDDRAPRFLRPASYPNGRLLLTEVRAVDDMAVLTYRPQAPA
ncbi:MAG TPA: dihydrofolate reductase family protein [Pseudonocardia sp.]|jgi:5-amino-6-(5-phosphoribosylamino)uracil reductase